MEKNIEIFNLRISNAMIGSTIIWILDSLLSRYCNGNIGRRANEECSGKPVRANMPFPPQAIVVVIFVYPIPV